MSVPSLRLVGAHKHLVTVVAHARYSFIDLTLELHRAVSRSGVHDGLVVAYCGHTTCSLLLNEWESGVHADLVRRIQTVVPDDCYYEHDDLSVRTQNLTDDERSNGSAHVAQMLMGSSSHTIPVEAGAATLGRWQRLFLFELDEPRPREVRFHVYGS